MEDTYSALVYRASYFSYIFRGTEAGTCLNPTEGVYKTAP